MEFQTLAARGVVVEALTLPGDLMRYDLIADFLRVRKRVFVDEKAWSLHHAEGVEFEQYDTFDTTYVIAHCDGDVLGGARLKRTDRQHGTGEVSYSYMIRDAALGLLPGMPSNLCSARPPIDPRVWELTRLVAEPIAGLAERILEVSNAYLFAVGASRCLFLGSPAFLRMANRLGWKAKQLGDVVGNTDGRFVAFECDVLEPDQRRHRRREAQSLKGAKFGATS